MAQQQVFEDCSKALAVIPREQTFAVFEGDTGGRAVGVNNPYNPGVNEWTHDQYSDAIIKGKIPLARYFLRPYRAPGKLVASSQRITLNLEMANDNASVNGDNNNTNDMIPAGGGMPQFMPVPHIQETVLSALMSNMDDYKLEISDLKEDLDTANGEINRLKLENADLKHKLEDSAREDTVGQVFSKSIVTLLQNPQVGGMLASKLLQSGVASTLVSEAVSKAAKESEQG